MAEYKGMDAAGVLSGDVRAELLEGEIVEMPPISALGVNIS